MKLQNFQLEVAEWTHDADRAALQSIRQQVFVVEQHVPEARERDGLDGQCWHVLARDVSGEPIGCARLAPEHKIGRMAVLAQWRGQGVGVALLRELVARARSQGWQEVGLAAQASAIDFYAREGFVAYGEQFEDAGLPHQAMRLALSPAVGDKPPLRDNRPLPASNRSDTAATRLQLLAAARHRLTIYLPILGHDSYNSLEELAELRRVAVSGRGAQIRILLHDPAAALRNDHRLIALAQRLPSAIQIRMPVEEADLTYISTYLLNDVGGYLFLPEADGLSGRAAADDRAAQAPLQQHFNEVWERAEPASALQALHI